MMYIFDGWYFHKMRCKMGRIKDLTKQRYGRLYVLEKTEMKNNNGSTIFKCQCECGNIKLASSNDLIQGNIVSCGCKQRENLEKSLVMN